MWEKVDYVLKQDFCFKAGFSVHTLRSRSQRLKEEEGHDVSLQTRSA